MSQEAEHGRIADDFPSIAARLRELKRQSGELAMWAECRACGDRGWVWSASASDWRRCMHCRRADYCPKPRRRL